MALTVQQQQDVARYWGNVNFVQANLTANFNTNDLIAAAAAIDGAFDTTLTAAVAAVGGGTTVMNGLNQVIPAPFSGATAVQKTLLCCYVLMKRAGAI
jgi:hypothetical protein